MFPRRGLFTGRLDCDAKCIAAGAACVMAEVMVIHFSCGHLVYKTPETPLGGTFREEKQPLSSLPVSAPVGPALTSLAPVQRVVWGPGKAMDSLWVSLPFWRKMA